MRPNVEVSVRKPRRHMSMNTRVASCHLFMFNTFERKKWRRGSCRSFGENYKQLISVHSLAALCFLPAALHLYSENVKETLLSSVCVSNSSHTIEELAFPFHINNKIIDRMCCCFSRSFLSRNLLPQSFENCFTLINDKVSNMCETLHVCVFELFLIWIKFALYLEQQIEIFFSFWCVRVFDKCSNSTLFH